MEKRFLLRKFYNLVMAQAISSSGRYLFVGNCFGDIFVEDLNELEQMEEPYSSLKIFPQGKRIEIYALAFRRDFLIVGTTGMIYGLKWDEESVSLSEKRSWEIIIPMNADALDVPHVNAMWLHSHTDTMFAACGDNFYKIDLEDGRIVRCFEGHTDFIHGISGDEATNLFTASEDGTVRMWCENDKLPTGMIEPCKSSELARPEFGNWIGAVTANKNWIACGGGPKFAMWHLASMKMTHEFSFPGKVHTCDFVDDNVFVAGEHKTVQSYTLTGELVADIPVESSVIYSIAWQRYPTRFMSLAGYGNKLHMLNDFRFLDSKIDMYDEKNFKLVCFQQ